MSGSDILWFGLGSVAAFLAANFVHGINDGFRQTAPDHSLAQRLLGLLFLLAALAAFVLVCSLAAAGLCHFLHAPTIKEAACSVAWWSLATATAAFSTWFLGFGLLRRLQEKVARYPSNRNHRLLGLLSLIFVLGYAFWLSGWWIGPVASVFFPHLDAPEKPFDLKTTLFEDKPVADLIELALHGNSFERNSAVLGIGHVSHGCTHHCMHSMDTAPPVAIRRMQLAMAEHGRVRNRIRTLLPTLLKTLDDPEPEVRASTAFVLMDIGPQALAACPSLRNHLNDIDSRTRLWAARALYFIAFETTLPISTSVHALLHDPQASSRSMAAYNLDLMGSDASTASDALTSALNDPDQTVRSQAQQALQAMR